MNATINLENKHFPVLLNELISIISPLYSGTFIDCTFGQGGVSKKILENSNNKVHVGNLFSSDLFYDPRGLERFDMLRSMGILAVEMEAAGLYGVAAEYGANSLAVVTVSDVIRGEEFKQMTSEERELGLKTMVEITLDSL